MKIYAMKKMVDSIFFFYRLVIISGYSSVVERDLAKVDVARSNRVTRFKKAFHFFFTTFSRE